MKPATLPPLTTRTPTPRMVLPFANAPAETGIWPNGEETTEAVAGPAPDTQPPTPRVTRGRAEARAKDRSASRRDKEESFMGIGGSDYSHRSDQRSSLRHLGQGRREAALDTVHA